MRRLATSQSSTGFEDLPNCLSLILWVDGDTTKLDFGFMDECKSSSKVTRIKKWATAGGDFNYWYKVPGPDSVSK